MHILIVTFELDGLSHEAYGRICTELAPTFAALPGLVSKIWLADPATNTYGGVYLWQSRAALESYLETPIFRGLGTHPHLKNVSARPFDSSDEANAITAGPLPAAVSR